MAEEIEVAEYDTRWPARFATEAEQTRRLLDRPSLEIEHHGSPAVPGLAAKPVIDMLVAVDSIGSAEQYAATLVQNGYEPVDRRYRDQWPERIVVIRRESGALDALTNVDLNMGLTYELMGDPNAACQAFDR